MLNRFRATPLGQAISSMLAIGVFAIIVRFTWGVVDPDMRGWSLVGAAPVLGLLTYLQASGREAALATLFIAIGVLGLAFWTVLIASGMWPIARADIPWVVVIYAFPLVALGIGFHKRRELQRRASAK